MLKVVYKTTQAVGWESATSELRHLTFSEWMYKIIQNKKYKLRKTKTRKVSMCVSLLTMNAHKNEYGTNECKKERKQIKATHIYQ